MTNETEKQVEQTNKAEGSAVNNSDNIMRQIKIEKVVLNVGATGEDLERGVKLLKFLSGKKPAKMKSTKRIPSWAVRPGLEVGAVVTLRRNYEELLKKLLAAEDNQLKRKQIAENQFSFGVKEYLEIPGVEFQRDIGIMGLDVTLVFKRTGRRVKLKKIKPGRIPKRQAIPKEDIIKFMEDKFNIEFVGK